MTECVFCKIAKGLLPRYEIYEDDYFLGFLDHKPLNIGNSLLIPKKHYRWVYDVEKFAEYWTVAKNIALASLKALKAESISFLTLGYEVAHAHIRIIPRFKDDGHQNGINLDNIKNQESSRFQSIQGLITTYLKSTDEKDNN